MKTKIKATTYLPSFITLTIIGFCYVGMTLDKTVIIYSWQWWIFGIIAIGLFLLFLISFLKIPRIEIINNIVHSKLNGTRQSFRVDDITKIERINSHANSWFTFRGGLNILTKNGNLIFPFHIYSNETEMLQQIYKSDKKVVNPISNYSVVNFSFIKYFYRNSYSFFLIPIVGFIFILQSKDQNSLLGIVVISMLITLLMTVILRTFKYLKLDDEYLYYINPIILKSCKYDLKSIEHANSRVISTGRGAIKNMTIELTNKQILTLNAGLNRQKTLDEIERKLNTRSNNR